jgi:hypothetical protein
MKSLLSKCKVCFYDCNDFLPWGMDGASPSYDICPCCGVEFGYEDSSEQGVLRYRERWLAEFSITVATLPFSLRPEKISIEQWECIIRNFCD